MAAVTKTPNQIAGEAYVSEREARHKADMKKFKGDAQRFFNVVLAELDRLDDHGEDHDDMSLDAQYGIVRAWEVLRGRKMKEFAERRERV